MGHHVAKVRPRIKGESRAPVQEWLEEHAVDPEVARSIDRGIAEFILKIAPQFKDCLSVGVSASEEDANELHIWIHLLRNSSPIESVAEQKSATRLRKGLRDVETFAFDHGILVHVEFLFPKGLKGRSLADVLERDDSLQVLRVDRMNAPRRSPDGLIV